jgi:hypothetical protein
MLISATDAGVIGSMHAIQHHVQPSHTHGPACTHVSIKQVVIDVWPLGKQFADG